MTEAVQEPKPQLTRADVAIEDTWDLTTIYATDDAWESEFVQVNDELARAASHQGHLAESPERLREALDDVMRLRHTLERLGVYATLRHHEDTAEPIALARYERSRTIGVKAAEALAYFDPELLAMPEATLTSYSEDPRLTTYRFMLRDLARRRPHTRSLEVEQVLAQASDVTRGPSEVFNALDNADLTFGTVLDEDGIAVTLTKGRASSMLESKNREVRRAVHEAFTDPYLERKHTLAALHAASVRTDVFQARVRGYESAREAALFEDNVPVAVYDTLVSTIRGASPVLARYLDLRRRVLGIDTLWAYDLNVPLSPEPERKFTYRDGVNAVLDGVSDLGDRYVNDLRLGFDSRWVDVHETKGKRSGAYSWGVYGAPPVMLMNWNETFDDVFTLAHEAGHAMHSFYADEANTFHDAQYTIFLAEIASTVNETLMTWKLVDALPSDDALGRFALLNRFADQYFGTVVRQAMFAEFEATTHAMAEGDEPLTLESLMALYGDLYAVYTPGVEVTDRVRITWARVPHFYRAFYVYQYATGLSAAISLAAAMRDEGAPAQRRYLDMLAAGGRDYPLEILRTAGVDLTSPEPIHAGVAEFDRVVREMEAIEASGALAR